MLFLPKKIKGALLCLLFLAPFAMAQAPQITYPSEANLEGTVGQYQSWQFESDQWDSGNEWSVVGTLPDGLWLNNYCWSGYCNIYGEPETAGTFSFTLRIENSNGPSTRTFTMEIKPPPPPQIAYPEESSLEVALGQYVDWGFESSDWREGSEWSVVGTLPDGLELSWWCQNSSSCYIYGEPETAGTFSFTLRIENSKGSSTRTFTLDVRIPNSPEIATASLPSGTMGEYYGEYLEASDFAKWRVESGALPDGLSLYTSGEIDGMPTKKGTYTFTVKAENVSGSSTKQFSITIDAEQQKPQITHDYVRDGKVGEYFWGMLESDLAANWSISGSLPPGLALDCGSYSSGCYIEGTPTTTGTYSFTLKATNSVGSSEKAFSIKIYSEGSPPYIIAINTWLDNGTWGERYSQQFQAFDDTDEDITNKVNWSITSNSAYGCFNPYPPTPLPHLPPGLALNASNGTISGTPTEAGNYCFTVMAENSAGSDRREFRISIENVPAEILTASMLKGEVGALYNVSLQSKGSGITWSISSGSLPSGLRLNAETGVISGMPESGTEGDHTFEVRAENYFDYSSWWQEKEFTITVEAMKPAAITTETLAKGTVGSTYYGRISSTSYLATIEKTSGDDIPGLTLNPSGTFSGAPTKAGTYKFKVKATNEAGSAGEKELTLIVEEAPAVDDGSPIRSQIAVARGGNARAYAQGSAIVLENIPQNSKVEVYSLKGRQVYSGSSENSQTLRILVQSKGVYVVKANKAAYRISVR